MMDYGSGGSGYGSMMGSMMGFESDGSGYGSMMMGFGAIWMGLWTLLVIAGLVLLVFVIVRLARGDSSRMDGTRQLAGTAHQILDERYARGEIDEDDYRRRREKLQ